VADRNLVAALAEARTLRKANKLRAAGDALDRAFKLVDPDDAQAARGLADEATRLGASLESRGAPLAALSEHLRAVDLAPEDLPAARAGIDRGLEIYPTWTPPLGPIAAKDALLVGATGAIWVNRDQRGRIVVLQGSITADTVLPARKALEVASRDVSWLLVDVKKLAYVNSTGLAATVKVAEGLEASGGTLVMFSVASNLALVIETLGLGRYLKIVPDLRAAFARARERTREEKA
jgi:anti-anti-sigma factor